MADMASTLNSNASLSDGLGTDITSHAPGGVALDAIKLMFGSWPEKLFASGTTVSDSTTLTYIAGYINFLAMMLIIIIIGYVMIAGVIKTATEGRILGGWSSVWLPGRTLIACILLAPLPWTGVGNLSVVQGFVAYLGMVGSNAADEVSIYYSKNVNKSSFSTELKAQNFENISALTKIAFCVGGYNYADVGPDRIHKSVYVNFGNDFNIPIQDVLKNDSLLDRIKTINVGYQGTCGSINFDIPDDFSSQQKLKAKKYVLNQLNGIYNDVVVPLDGYTISDYNAALSNNSSIDSGVMAKFYQASAKIKSVYEDFSTGFYNSMLEKNSDTLVENHFIQIKKAEDENKNTIMRVNVNSDTFSGLGWGYSGAYYPIMSTAMSQANKYNQLSTGVAKSYEPDGCYYESSHSFISYVKSAFKECSYLQKYSLAKPLITKLSKDIIGDSNNKNYDDKIKSVCSGSECDTNILDKYVGQALSAPMIIDHTKQESNAFANVAFFGISLGGSDLYNDFVGSNGNKTSSLGFRKDGSLDPLYFSDPITFTNQLGHRMMMTTSYIKIGLAMANGVAEGAKTGPGVWFFTGVFGGFIQYMLSGLDFFNNLVMAEAAAMAYFIPMLPALIWGMVFIGWILMFAEAVINSPLAVVLMATPEGEGISGSRMERQIALLAALVLKPTFLVIGLILSMFILSIGFVFINQIFWISAGNTSSSFDPLTIVAIFSAWFTCIITFMHNTFKIIPTFADNSLEWFLGGAARSFGNNYDGGATDALTGQASKVGSDSVQVGFGQLGADSIKKGKKGASSLIRGLKKLSGSRSND